MLTYEKKLESVFISAKSDAWPINLVWEWMVLWEKNRGQIDLAILYKRAIVVKMREIWFYS